MRDGHDERMSDMITEPAQAVMLQPIAIPPTTPRRYISFHWALNLREPDEDTGDWHFDVMFFCRADQPPQGVNLAGEGMAIDSTVALGERGVRDMAHELASGNVRPLDGPVYVANHYRAMADLALAELLKGWIPPDRHRACHQPMA